MQLLHTFLLLARDEPLFWNQILLMQVVPFGSPYHRWPDHQVSSRTLAISMHPKISFCCSQALRPLFLLRWLIYFSIRRSDVRLFMTPCARGGYSPLQCGHFHSPKAPSRTALYIPKKGINALIANSLPTSPFEQFSTDSMWNRFCRSTGAYTATLTGNSLRISSPFRSSSRFVKEAGFPAVFE